MEYLLLRKVDSSLNNEMVKPGQSLPSSQTERLEGCAYSGCQGSCRLPYLSFAVSQIYGLTQVLVVSHLDASSMLHLASSSTQMAVLISAPIEWQNLIKKVKLNRLGAKIFIGHILSLRI